MVSQISFTTIDPNTLLSYYSAQVQMATVRAQNAAGQNIAAQTQSTSSGATAKDAPPWENLHPPAQQARDAQVLGLTNFVDTSKVPPSISGTNGALEQDNQKLFALYSAVNNLSYLASMSQRAGMSAGQQAGFDTRFQAGLKQVESYISSTAFNKLTLQMGQTLPSVTSTAAVPSPVFDYTGATVASDSALSSAVPGLSASDSFSIAVKKNGTTANVNINLSQVPGTLTLDNIIAYTNQQLAAAGSTSKLTRTVTKGTINDPTKASYGIAITEAPGESLTLSAAAASPALYLAGSSGTAAATSTASGSKTVTTAADQQGRLVKLSVLTGSTPQSAFNQTLSPSTGNTNTAATAVDGNGNVYTLGTATGNFGSQLNQGTQDVILSKYDSAGNLQWTKMLGGSGSANGYSLAVDSSNNIVVAGSTTSNLSAAGIANGNQDSFVAKYDTNGNQTWVTQIPTLAANSANAVSVDTSGNIYIGGQVSGVIGSGQTSAGGQDGYIAKLNASGAIQYEHQLGTSGTDTVGATAAASDGSLYVASVQNGQAVLSKYANGDATQPAVWTQNLGALGTGGAISGLTVNNGKIYLSGSTANAGLTSGGQAQVIGAPSGGLDAFVAGFTDSGSAVTANTVTYVGTSGADTAGAVTTDASGNVYLTGTTTGTFSGQQRSASGTQNAFVAQLSASGQINWTQQYGGASGTSTGAGVAIDNSGTSVLDALGLPRGTLNIAQSVDVAGATTARPGDSFQIKVQRGGATSLQTITLEAGDTMQTLAGKINNALVFAGSAKVNYGGAGNGLKISVNSGVSATLIAGPADSDLLGRLGIAAGTISNGTSTAPSTSSSTSSTTVTKPVIGLGLTGTTLSIASSTAAGAAKAILLNVQNAISSAYRQLNSPAAPASATPNANANGPVPAYLTAQNAGGQLALSLLAGASVSTSA